MYHKPLLTAIDDETIAIGQKVYFNNKVPMIPEFVPILNHAGQHAHFTLELGSSIEKVMKSEEPLLKSLSEGFRVEAKTCIVSNMKRVFMEMAKSEEHAEMVGPAMFGAPVFMLALQGKVNINFTDFEEIESHPMAAPLMATFEQLFEGAIGRSADEFLEDQFDIEGIPKGKDEQIDMVLMGVELHSMVMALVDDMPHSPNVTITTAIPDLLICSEVEVRAPGLKEALQLGLHAPISEFQR